MLDDLRTDTWHPGQLLAFSALDGTTDFEAGLVARTAGPGVALQVVHPDTCRLCFAETNDGRFFITSDAVEVETSSARARCVLLDAHHLLVEGPCVVSEAGSGLSVVQSGDRTLLAPAGRLDRRHLEADVDAAFAARTAWLASRTAPSGLSECRRRAVARALSQMKGQVCSPEGAIRRRWTTPDRWPHRAMWLWDSAFHAIGWRHVDLGVARDAISAVLGVQREDGFIPHTARPSGTSAVTQPPVLALAAACVDRIEPDTGWLNAIYPSLCAYVRWDTDHRDTDGAGLVEWHIEGDPHCRSGESGMDNSPRFDTATQLDAVDFNAFLAAECEHLADFAGRLGRDAERDAWRAEHARLCDLINERLWDEEAGLYVDYDVDRAARSPVLASSGFLPLLCGAPSQDRAERLARRLADPDTFGTPLPVPSVAVRDAEHYAKDMWRGPVWLNVNWLIAAGLDRYGLQDAARRIRDRSLETVESCVASHGTFFEFYDDRQEVAPPALLRKGACDPDQSPYHQVIHDYGWTATLYLDTVLSDDT